MYNFKVETRPITPGEYQHLRSTTNWESIDLAAVETALKRDLFSVCVIDNTSTVGIGRVIGDGVIYFYIQDVIVLPAYHNKGVGTLIMNAIEHYLKRTAKGPVFVGLMAAKETLGFYEKFDYKKRPDNAPGMFKTINKS